ncbi:hypothetical protein AUC70_10065 [Methyloceanibacter stevinii]|uniref:Uncharacterized protein n=1 Tax=Methyloceanibacter stevinii TaxID=1774970 RepID=A0A1E3VKA6_9HYPH|nr:hypothetical protein [Methyloceanibacter stevinii]ODR93943.1 hypothetical protein AUC70_10065 [Methyloceanibacter stevinii]
MLLREFSSEAAHEHAEFLKFLENSRSFDESKSHSEDRISPSSLRPVFSTLFYRCAKFHPKRFFQGLPDRYELVDVWLNEPEHTLYFAVRLRETVRWSNSQEMRQLEWHLFVLHHDQATRLLYLASTDKASDHGALADAVGAQERMSGEEMFRPLGRIGRLVFNNLGVTKHGRRNLSFAMYTGVDVRQALSETEKKGSRKSNISGYGWEDGKQITIGCSYKGRVWSKAAGTIPKFIKWAHGVGEKLVDPTISTKDIIANVLIPDYAERLPDAGILSIEWPVELLGRSEDQISIRIPGREFDFLDSDIKFTNAKPVDGVVEFEVTAGERDTPVGQFRMRVEGRAGFTIESLYGTPKIVIGSKESDLAAFFGDYPPLIRFVDLSELDGNILLRAEDAGTVEIPSDRLEPWDWSSVDITKESLWKDGARRLDSIQWSVAQNFINAGFSLVFDDDGPNEIADLICMKHDDGFIRLVLVHCKFSGSEIPGARVADVVEVASQAVRSARWPGRFKELVRHLQLRERRHKPTPGRTSYLHGAPPQLVAFQRSSRFQEVRPAVLIVQPGLSKSKLTREQSVVLGAAAAYLKQTIGIELEVVCSA